MSNIGSVQVVLVTKATAADVSMVIVVELIMPIRGATTSVGWSTEAWTYNRDLGRSERWARMLSAVSVAVWKIGGMAARTLAQVIQWLNVWAWLKS